MGDRRVGIALVILGVALLGVAGYIWVEYDLAHYGQGTYAITGMEGATPAPTSTLPDDATVIAYGDLPPAAQRAFRKSLRGEGNRLWSRSDRRAVDTVLPYSGEYVEYGGEYYRILVLSGHRGQGFWLRGGLTFLATAITGLILVALGGRTLVSTADIASLPGGE